MDIEKQNEDNLTDSFGRKIDYLRLSVTDRCDLRCIYCMPEEGISLLKHKDMLDFEEISRSVEMLIGAGIKKIRVTGGEPLVRKDIVKLIKNIKSKPGLEDLSITTNGILLGQYLQELKDAGIDRLNISIDSLDPYKYRNITRGGDLKNVLNNLKKAKEIGFKKIKINTVITEMLDIEDIRSFIRFSMENELNIRFIEMMQSPFKGDGPGFSESIECSSTYPVFLDRTGPIKGRITIKAIKDIMQEFGITEKADDVEGFGPSVYYKNKNSKGAIGFIINDKSFCSFCNRIRLTASGAIRLCLFSDIEFDLKKRLRSGMDMALIKQELFGFIKEKPENREESCRLKNWNLDKKAIKNGKTKKDLDLRLTEYMNKIGG